MLRILIDIIIISRCNTLLHIYNTFLHIDSVGCILSWLKTQVNTECPQSRDFSPTLISTGIFHRAHRRIHT